MASPCGQIVTGSGIATIVSLCIAIGTKDLKHMGIAIGEDGA
jgi:hypothetical protein